MAVGSWVLGLLNGLTIGLLAVGLVLIYKSNRFLNLAHAQLGTLPALLLAKWRLDWHWNWWLAFPAAIAAGIVTALLVERLLVRPMLRRSRSPVRLLLLSLAVSQLLLAMTYIPDLGPKASDQSLYPQPFHSSASVGGVVLSGMDLLTAIVVPLIVIALTVFLRYTMLGKQIRATANNPDAARLCGVPVGRVGAIAWGMAGACSVVSAVLQAPNQSSFNFAPFGPYLLMLTLGAAALGAFVSLPWALAGGILIGLLNQLVIDHTSDATDSELVVFLLILAIVLVRGRALARAFGLAGGAADERPILRVPAALRSNAAIRNAPLGAAAAGLVLLAVWPLLPYFHTTGHEFLLALVLVYALLGIALTMLMGWGGQVSLGHFAVVGLGAYLTARWGQHGLSLPVLCIAIGLVGALCLVVIGLPALRVRGLSLAVTSLGFAVIATDWLFHQSWVGTSQAFGVTVDPPRLADGLGTPTSQIAIYYVALVVLVLSFGAAHALRRSGPGRLVVAVKDNERASAAFGVTPASVKMAMLALSGFIAGVAGVLWADAWKQVAPSQFSADVSIAIVAIPVIGGLGSLGGAVTAAVLIYGGTFFIGPHVAAVFGNLGNNLGFNLFLAGALQILVLIRFPSGIGGAAQSYWQRWLDRRAGTAAAALPDQPVATPEARDDAFAAPSPARPDEADTAVLALEVHELSVSFGGIVALNRPSIEVRRGEIVGLIGTNGAGKTTLMNVITGMLRSQGGSVKLFGDEVLDLPTDIRAAGFGLARSFQDATLFGSLTVTEAVQVPLSRARKVGIVPALVGAPWARDVERQTREEARRIVDRFGLSDWADVRTSELSTGTRRICDLAAQVAARPKLLLLDEPTAGVAQREAEAFGPLLRRIRDELGCAILIVEHDMPLLMGLCDRVYALETGAVIAEGTPQEIRANARVVASYLGSEQAAIERSDRRRGAAAKATKAPRRTK
ncbi:MAG TPA: branched-chain amino acid ABC transporter permease/ATP-binding protein [Mycobacteriales bacterium]|nr:branched-chain amino acid ABC transporter permease/ATP-binding protein [Mycobacteriales bacterium]